MERQGRLSGLDLTPLPFESSLSILWRLAWRNALSTKLLNRLLGKTQAYSARDGLFGRKWIDSKVLLAATGWEVPSTQEQEFCRTLGFCKDAWAASHVRYCPMCLGEGYHSFWHQFSGVDVCPVHHVLLSTTCSQCGSRTPILAFCKELFDRAYLCPQCHTPISGQPLSTTVVD